jgi:type IV secretory pathway protease TraF
VGSIVITENQINILHAASKFSLGKKALNSSIKNRATKVPIGRWRISGWNLPTKKTKVFSIPPSRGIKRSPISIKVEKTAKSKLRFITAFMVNFTF